MHFYCAFAILVSKWSVATRRNAYMHNFFMMLSVPFYQGSIFLGYFALNRQDSLSYRVNCAGIKFSFRRVWVFLEISAFVVNILQLMLSLIKLLKPCGGGACCNVQVDEDSSDQNACVRNMEYFFSGNSKYNMDNTIATVREMVD